MCLDITISEAKFRDLENVIILNTKWKLVYQITLIVALSFLLNFNRNGPG